MIKKTYLFFKFVFNKLSIKNRYNILFTCLISVCCNILSVLIPLFQKKIIDYVYIGQLNNKSILLFLASGIMLCILSLVEVLILNNIFISLQFSLQTELMGSVTKSENKIIKARGAGAFMVNMFGDSEHISSLVNEHYLSIISVAISAVIVIIISLQWTYTFVSIILCSYILIYLSIMLCNKIFIKNFSSGKEMVYKINPLVLEHIENRKSVMCYTNVINPEENLKNFFKERDKYFKSANASMVIEKTLVESIKNIAVTMFFILSIREIFSNKLQISSFIAMLSYFTFVFSPLNMFQSLYNGVDKFDNIYNKIKDCLDIVPNCNIPENNSLSINNCSIKYDNDNYILKNISLNVNESIGIVGLSGEGKTTIIKLLLGELLPTEGEIKLGNSKISDISMPLIYSYFRLYGQETEIFDNDLEYNITLGKIGVNKFEYDNIVSKTITNIEECFTLLLNSNKKNLCVKYEKLLCEIYSIDKSKLYSKGVINNLVNYLQNKNIQDLSKNLSAILVSRKYYINEKYNQLLEELELSYLDKRMFGQRGKSISGGEKNKICLARLLLPENNSIFIIDEPFTSLDLFSENKNLEILKRYIKNKPAIVISHKMNVIRDLSDEIFVLCDGKVSVHGTHSELVNKPCLYSELYTEMLAKNI